ncbi:phosphodiester glycosidase family protein [Bacillus rubiinfantis]|uniref:phosphodiester glycosidase family protein n=1 Tax=Bacillus rubiinfantis TaxID=1499680 RepID=UPI0005A6D39C|nr:phosphodiester glycosidase family protein [Bacillus rubiinfantis]
MKGLRCLCSLLVVLAAVSPLSIDQPASAATVLKQQYRVSTGVTYQDYRLSSSARKQAVRVLKVNLNDRFTRIEAGIPNPLNKLSRVVARALTYYAPRHQVVGTINASFFGSTGLPVYFIAQSNQLINAGKLPVGKTEYANEPIAFGIQNGKGMISHYKLDFNFILNGRSYPITASNKKRTANQLILYTPGNPSVYTNTSEKGIEVVVGKLNSPLRLNFGSKVTGVVTQIRNYGDKKKLRIPKDGFVLSAPGKKSTLKSIRKGDSIALSVDINNSWKGASFILGSGPLLVNNGKVSISMDPKSPNAITRAPRTAVAIDKTKRNIFFVTVDGRLPGYSTGMNLTEFAKYLVSIGAYQALNLDGGGSTTMAVRKPGSSVVKLANTPSDKRERLISTSLMAVSTAPIGQPRHLKIHKSTNSVLLKGSSIHILIDYVLDQYYNPLRASTRNIKLTSKWGSAKGTTFTARKAGKGSIKVQYQKAAATVPIEVVDKLAKLKPSRKSVAIRNGNTVKLSIKGYDRKGRAVVMSPSSVKWSVTGKIGSISKGGTFKAAKKSKGSGKIIAAYGKTKTTISVKIVSKKKH